MASKPRAKADEDVGPIVIRPIEQTNVEVSVLGETPLIYNAVSEKAQRELLFPAAKKNIAERAATFKHDPLSEYRLSVYRGRKNDGPTRLVLLATMFKGAMMSAALRIPGLRKTETGQLVWVRGSDPSLGVDLVSVYGKPQLKMDVVRMADAARTPDIRTRAILPQWCCKMQVRYVSPLLTAQAVVNLQNASGLISGVGDFRQEKGKGSYGQFALVGPDSEEWLAIAKQGGRDVQDAALETPEFYDFQSETMFTWFHEEVQRRGRAADLTKLRREIGSAFTPERDAA